MSLLMVVVITAAGTARAQTARISGFVTDRSNGRALEGATVALYRESDTYDAPPTYGTATDSRGAYILGGIEPGEYLLQISFVGYGPYRDSLSLAPGNVRTITVALQPSPEGLDEVIVEEEGLHGPARVTGGHQRIRPEEIELIPAPDISADLANYLTVLPGVVTTGDRGGQFFIRGGEPSQNLILLDGMILYQPFHVLGFYSAFPSEIVNRVDLYAGGYGAKYAGRLSSVIDVLARSGNNRRVTGSASISPFTSAISLEGPIVLEHASFLFSVRESIIDRIARDVYGEEMPFRFGDAFGKLHVVPSPRDRLSATVLRTHDRGTLVKEIGDERENELRWTNTGAGLTWMMLPRTLPVVAELTVSHSRHEMLQGPARQPIRSTTIQNTRIALDATFSEGSFFGGRSTTLAGWDVTLAYARNELGGLFQNVEDRGSHLPTFGLYVEPEYTTEGGLRISPVIRAQWYNVRHGFYLEPRIRAGWDRGIHHWSVAVGRYHQQVVGLNDRRDAASVFTAWTGIPRITETSGRFVGRTERPRTFTIVPRVNADLEHIGGELLRGRLGSAVHAVLGYGLTPFPWLDVGLEGFYKRATNIFVGELTPLPRLSTRLLPATGRSMGGELRMEIRRDPGYVFLTYGLSSTRYVADGRVISLSYETDGIRYRPSHDRRHQVNAVLGLSTRYFGASLRWQFGSGLPYTRPLSFDGFALVDDTHSAFDLQHSRRVIYDRPFGSELPTYHRLDVSIERDWQVRGAVVTLQATAINIYDRRNIFYVDIFTLERKDQLPFVPSLGLKIAFE